MVATGADGAGAATVCWIAKRGAGIGRASDTAHMAWRMALVGDF